MDNNKITPGKVLLNVFLTALSLCFLLPFLLIVGVSITNEDALMQYGYNIIPAQVDFAAYQYVFNNPTEIINAYKTTAFEAIFGTVASLLLMSMVAFALSRKNYKWRQWISFYIYFTSLFSGGLIPTYILNTQYLHLGNTIWVYIIPALATPFSIITLRTFFQGIPYELSEAAKIDGCNEFGIFFNMILPLSKPALATIGLMSLVTKWNDWNTSLIYIRDEELYTLQYLLQRILNEVEFLETIAKNNPSAADMVKNAKLPSESLRFAMCVVAAGPMLLVFPFFQKYFARGLTVGAVKG